MTKKEKQSAYRKAYYQLNKEKELAKNKAYQESNKDKISIQQKEYYELNKEGIKNRKYDYRKKNKEKLSVINKKYYESNKEAVKLAHAIYEKNNKDKIKERKRKRQKERLEVDYLFKIRRNIGRSMRKIFNLKGIKKETRTLIILGCNIDEFILHIEKQFQPWMNWNNYGAYKLNGERTWNLDHIIPISSAKTEEDIIKLNHHTNLRPLCSKENSDKGNRFI